MASTSAFVPGAGPNGAPSAVLTVSGSSVNSPLPGTGNNALFYNSSTVAIAVNFGDASVTASFPTLGTNSASIVLPPGAYAIFGFPATAAYWAANGASGNVYITQGDGL